MGIGGKLAKYRRIGQELKCTRRLTDAEDGPRLNYLFIPTIQLERPLYVRTGAGVYCLGIYDVKGSVCFVLKLALPPFSPPLPSGVQISKQNRHRTFDVINT